MALIPEAPWLGDGWERIATLEKEIVGMEEEFGMIKAFHPDGTYSLVVLPEDRAELTGDLP